MRRFNQAGFSLLHISIAILFIGVIGFAAYRVVSKNGEKNSSQDIVSDNKNQNSISSKQDLNNAVDNLRKVDTNSTQKEEESLKNL